MKPKCILFAGPGGCSKTPVAYYLSWNLNLPIFNNDTIRTEVIEDKFVHVPQDPEYIKRRDERLEVLLGKRSSFIYDASIDREWKLITEALEENGYEYFIISYDLSKEMLIKRGVAKGYGSYAELTETWHSDHEAFLKNSGLKVGLTINDSNFEKRLQLSLDAIQMFLEN